MSRVRTDRCPGVGRPWPADDGLLVRLRLIGGAVSTASLRALVEVAETYGDGQVHLTGRANLQVRGLPSADGALPGEVLTALEATGLVPAQSHELVRNVMVSPQTGLSGGRADLRGVAATLDRLLCASPRLAALPGRFLFVLDDGRGDLVSRECDLGVVALSATEGQLRVGDSWGPVVPLVEAASRIAALASDFLDVRGEGPSAPWHVSELEPELDSALIEPFVADPRVPAPAAELDFGEVPGGEHVAAPDGTLDRAAIEALAERSPEVVVTPWRGVLVPAPKARPTRRYDYIDQGPAIYVDSFATIRREADLSAVPADAERLAVRMIHGSGQVDLAADLVIHPDLVKAARGALEAGAPILCDATMVATGVTRSRLPRDNEVLCMLGDDRVPALAREWGTTRTAAALSLWEPYLEGAVVAIGNAPTALFHLFEMILDGGPRPAAIVGCPVGFIGAAESKEALASFADDHGIDIPFVTVRGRRGGSAMTSSALNALAQEQE
ncbi:precorrin-8X methylmutase [Nocardioides albertanoniae]|uniref:Precorrin-8X methylmutase n=1 Tax=Nocardioides albertanoniae TaxID=1175486 RepID=A0A543A4Z1_9ACTN|nr:precorrin-8X methylmutase [Nocardioides albertanoniae]